jgi:hypothetical protein
VFILKKIVVFSNFFHFFSKISGKVKLENLYPRGEEVGIDSQIDREKYRKGSKTE